MNQLYSSSGQIIREKMCLHCKKSFKCVGSKQRNKKTCSSECASASRLATLGPRIEELKRNLDIAEDNAYRRLIYRRKYETA